jgi:hypothetical protein
MNPGTTGTGLGPVAGSPIVPARHTGRLLHVCLGTHRPCHLPVLRWGCCFPPCLGVNMRRRKCFPEVLLPVPPCTPVQRVLQGRGGGATAGMPSLFLNAQWQLLQVMSAALALPLAHCPWHGMAPMHSTGTARKAAWLAVAQPYPCRVSRCGPVVHGCRPPLLCWRLLVLCFRHGSGAPRPHCGIVLGSLVGPVFVAQLAVAYRAAPGALQVKVIWVDPAPARLWQATLGGTGQAPLSSTRHAHPKAPLRGSLVCPGVSTLGVGCTHSTWDSAHVRMPAQAGAAGQH